jgi:hypothetical protein
MNLLAHAHVALHLSDDARVVGGAILPDIESLLGPVLGDGRDDPAVALGIRLHHATDARFHADPRFRSGSIALTRALQERGVGRGASRAVGHAGWELILDGLLVDEAPTTAAFGAGVAAIADLAATAELPGARRLQQFAARQDATPIWVGYRDPVEVVERLQRQVAHRPLLAFPLDQVPLIADVLAEAVPTIATDGPGLIADVIDAVRAAATP